MSKVINQSIPSEFSQTWKRIFNPTMDPTTGYNYTFNGYDYCSLLGIRQSSTNNNKQGTEYPKVSEDQADVRCKLTKSSRVATEQLESGGVEYPETGARNKTWWYDNIPIGGCYWNDYCIQETLKNYDYHRRPPWGLSPTIWICSSNNQRLEKWNGNSMSFLDHSSGGPGIGQGFGKITRAATDDEYIYVCDRTSDKIHILNKETLAYVDNFSATTGTVHNFNEPYDIAVGENNLFIIEYYGTAIYVVNKSTYKLVSTIAIAGPEDWTTPRARGVTVDHDIVAVADYINGFVKIYGRTSFAWIKQITQRNFADDPILYATGIVSDGQFIYAIDPYNLSNYTLNISSGEVVNENTFADPITGGVGLSGDIVFNMGSLDSTLYKLVRPGLGEIAKLNNPGVGLGEFNMNYGVCGPPAFLWDAC